MLLVGDGGAVGADVDRSGGAVVIPCVSQRN